MPEAAPSNIFHGITRSELDAVLVPIAQAYGAEVADVEFTNGREGAILRVMVEKIGSNEQRLPTSEAAISLEACAGIARDLSPALDVLDRITHKYHLEVGSPGVERRLRTEGDFMRFEGQKAKLKLSKGIGAQKVIVGRLGPLAGGTLQLVDERGSSCEIPLADVVSAHLRFEFGPAPRPGKKAVKKKASEG